MTHYKLISAALGVVLTVTLYHPLFGQERQPAMPDHELISRLTSRNVQVIIDALGQFDFKYSPTAPNTIRMPDGTEVSDSVRAALIEALTYDTEQYGAYIDDKPYDASYLNSVPDGGILLSEVIALRDETAIPALLLSTGYGWASIDALLDFGPGVIPQGIECAMSDEIWTGAVSGCSLYLNTAVRLWRDQVTSAELERLHAIVRKRLGTPLDTYRSHSVGALYVLDSADLALALGWTEEYRALTHARLEELHLKENMDWKRDGILKALSGELSSMSVLNAVQARLK